MKAVTSGKKTHPAIKRVSECLQKLDTEDQQDRLSSLRKRVHSPDRSTRSAGNLQGHMWKGCATIKAKASPSKRQKSQTSPGLAKTLMSSTSASSSQDIYAMYGLSRDGQEALSKAAPASPAISIGSSNSSNNVQLAHVPAEETAPAEEASGSAGSNDIMLQYFCKASCKYITQMKDGTSKRHPVFKGPDGFLKTKVFGKLKELDVPNLFMQTFENAAAHGGISKIMKRPAAKKTAKKAPASAGSASADGKAEEPEEPELSTPPPKKLATPKSTSSPNPSPKSAATPQEDGSPNRDSLLCASVHYIMASDRTYITGKFGKTKALLIEIHSRKSDKHRDLCKELFKEAERLQSSMLWGELRELMRNRRDEVLQRQAE